MLPYQIDFCRAATCFQFSPLRICKGANLTSQKCQNFFFRTPAIELQELRSKLICQFSENQCHLQRKYEDYYHEKLLVKKDLLFKILQSCQIWSPSKIQNKKNDRILVIFLLEWLKNYKLCGHLLVLCVRCLNFSEHNRIKQGSHNCGN